MATNLGKLWRMMKGRGALQKVEHDLVTEQQSVNPQSVNAYLSLYEEINKANKQRYFYPHGVWGLRQWHVELF